MHLRIVSRLQFYDVINFVIEVESTYSTVSESNLNTPRAESETQSVQLICASRATGTGIAQ